jgi:hypothetical protein
MQQFKINWRLNYFTFILNIMQGCYFICRVGSDTHRFWSEIARVWNPPAKSQRQGQFTALWRSWAEERLMRWTLKRNWLCKLLNSVVRLFNLNYFESLFTEMDKKLQWFTSGVDMLPISTCRLTVANGTLVSWWRDQRPSNVRAYRIIWLGRKKSNKSWLILEF